MPETDPLQDLLVDETALARDELAAVLRPYVQLDRNGGVWLLDAFDSLTSELKVLCLLLAVKAQHLLDLREDDIATPAQLVEIGAMAAGTVRPKLSALARSRQVAKAGGGYSIPDAAARRAVTTLKAAG